MRSEDMKLVRKHHQIMWQMFMVPGSLDKKAALMAYRVVLDHGTPGLTGERAVAETKRLSEMISNISPEMVPKIVEVDDEASGK